MSIWLVFVVLVLGMFIVPSLKVSAAGIPTDNAGGDSSDNSGNDQMDNSGNDPAEDDPKSELEVLQAQITAMQREHQRELDRYRNEVGKLKKQLEEMRQRGMSEEEKLAAKQQELEQKEKELKVKQLEAHANSFAAKKGLDMRFLKYINILPDMSEQDIEAAVLEIKSLQDALKDEVVKELQKGGTVLNSFAGLNSADKGGTFGKQVASLSRQSEETVQRGVKYYFGN